MRSIRCCSGTIAPFHSIRTRLQPGVARERLLLTNGGPDGATEILPTLAYNTGIRGGALGRGAAISLFLLPILLPLIFFLLRALRRRQY